MLPFIIAAAVIGLDQLSKYIILINKDTILDIVNKDGEILFIKYIFNITYTTNPGASFGILKDHRWVFMVLSSVALILMTAAIIYFARKKSYMLLQIALALMFGGGVGNMIDRIFRGEVVDFIQFAFWKSFPIFNAADSFICIGSVLFCVCIFTNRVALFGDEKSNDNDTNAAENPEETVNESEEI